MSDNWLQFIPVDPNWIPTPAAAERAVALLSAIAPQAEEVNAEFKEQVEFFHPHSNWEGVECPVCGADIESWWDEAMEAASQSGFTDLTVNTPCCGAATSLNDLRYAWPAAFGRFVIEAMNPNIRDTTPEQDGAMAECVGSALRKVWVHI
jgi:hypothetical protein